MRSNHIPTSVEDVPVWVNLVGPCTQIGHALGLAVDPPDLVDRTEPEALLRLPSDTWKDVFEGRVADTMRNGGRGWVRLADYGFGSAYLDLEEGVKFITTVAGLADCLAFIVSLAGQGITLWDVDYMDGWGGESGSCVCVSQALLRAVPNAELAFKEVGLVPSGPDAMGLWTLPPDWAEIHGPGRHKRLPDIDA